MKITLTGIDEKTDVAKLYSGIKPEWRELVEIALLFITKPEGRNRYPSIEFIDTVLTSSLDYMASIVFNKEMDEHERGFLYQVVCEWADELRKQSHEYYNKVGKGG